MLNRCEFIGHLGKDPECRVLDSGISVATVSIATTKKYTVKDSGEKREITEWHNLVFWRGLADVVGKYLKKGDKIFVAAEHTTRSWEKDGVTRYMSEFVVQDMLMLNTKSGGGNREAPPEIDREATNADPNAHKSGKSGGQKNKEHHDANKSAPTVEESDNDLPF